MKKFIFFIFSLAVLATQSIMAQTDGFDPGTPPSPGQVFKFTIKQNIKGAATYAAKLSTTLSSYDYDYIPLNLHYNSEDNSFYTSVTAGNTVVLGMTYANAYQLDSIVTDNGEKYEIEASDYVSTSKITKFLMPHRDYTVTLYYSNILHPDVPYENMLDSLTGKLYVDYFKPGYAHNVLYDYEHDSHGNTGDHIKVKELIVAGPILENDYAILSGGLCPNVEKLDFSRTAGGKTIPSGSFSSYYSSLTEIVLPEDVQTINKDAFRCTQLNYLTCLAVTPPNVVDPSEFDDITGLVVHVPEQSISLYLADKVWGKLVVEPITENVRSLQVSLPEECKDGRCKGQYIELINHQTGATRSYVVTDRLDYTFHYLPQNSVYAARLIDRSCGDTLVCATLPDIAVTDADQMLTFSDIIMSPYHTLTLKVIDPEGIDMTHYYQYNYYRYLHIGWTLEKNGKTISDYNNECTWREGDKVVITIPFNDYLSSYCQPVDPIHITFPTKNDTLVVNLKFLPTITLKGVVVDEDTNEKLENVQAAITQGSNTNSYTLSDSKGLFERMLFEKPISYITFTKDGYEEKTLSGIDLTKVNASGELLLDTIKMRYGYTANITINYKYQKAVLRDTEDTDSTVANLGQGVKYSIYNLTQKRELSQFQQSTTGITIRPISLGGTSRFAPGDSLRITATSIDELFDTLRFDVELDSRCAATVEPTIVQNGGVRASFESTENEAVVGLLFDSDGNLFSRQNYKTATILFSELPKGRYTLVSMGRNTQFNSFNRLSQLSQLGLVENVDYVKNTVDVANGRISQVKNQIVPHFNAERVKYLSDNSYVSLKNTPHLGTYTTIYTSSEFLANYRNGITDVKLLIVMPKGVEYVDGSAMTAPVGADKGTIIKNASYDESSSMLTVPLDNPSEAVTPLTRFCIIPYKPGQQTISVSASFKYLGQKLVQPVGNLTMEFSKDDLTMRCDATINDKTFTVSGEVVNPYYRKGTVKVYDDATLIGRGTIYTGGTWTASCTLTNPVNMSLHNIYAVLELDNEVQMRTEVNSVKYNKKASRLRRVTMYSYNTEYKKSIVNVFDYDTYASPGSYTVFSVDSLNDYTFTIDFDKNDTTCIKDVVLHLETATQGWQSFATTWSDMRQCWVVRAQFPFADRPLDVDVSYVDLAEPEVDADDLNNTLSELMTSTTAQYTFFKAMADAEANGTELSEEEQEALLAALGLEAPEEEEQQEEQEPTLEPAPDFDSMTLEEMDAYFDSVASMLAEELPNPLDTLNVLSWQELADKMSPDATQADMSAEAGIKFTVADCDGLQPADLLAQGYEVLKMTDGDSLFVLKNDEVNDIVWLSRNKRYTITLSDPSAAVKALADGMLAPRRAEEVEETDDEGGFLEVVKAKANEILELKSKFTSCDLKQILEAAKTLTDRVKQVASYVQTAIDKLESNLDDLVNYGEKALQQSIKECNAELAILRQNKQATQDFIEKFKDPANRPESMSEAWYNKKAALLNNYDYEIEQKTKQCTALSKKLTSVSKHIKFIRKWVVKPVKKVLAKTILKVVNYVQIVVDIAVWEADYGKNVYERIPNPCKNEQEKADLLRDKAGKVMGEKGALAAGNFAAQLVLDFGGVMGLVAAVPSAGTSFLVTVGAVAVSLAKDVAVEVAAYYIDKDAEAIKEEVGELDCKNDDDDSDGDDDDDDDDGNGGRKGFPGGPMQGLSDPSGYVYEAVSSNRIEAATATLFEKSTGEDMYGDPIDVITQWDAENYNQVNPQQTDNEGKYRWDVPEGWWQVRINKSGYDNVQSDWLPVPPPQLDVNIPLVSHEQPYVTEARAYSDGAEVCFSKYMDPANFNTATITLVGVKDGVQTKVTDLVIQPVDATQVSDADSTIYAKRWTVRTATDLSQMDEAILTISPIVTSYSGAQLAEAYQQQLDIERRVQSLSNDSVYHIGVEEDYTLTLAALPADAVKGRKLLVTSGMDDMLTVTPSEVVFDEDGQATVTLNGQLAGTCGLSFAIDGTTFQSTSKVNIVDPSVLNQEMAAPTASRVSGTYVYSGQTVALSSANEDATIYYTLDGSCPCESTSRIKYTSPLAITSDMTLKALAVGLDGAESETSTFVYHLRTTDISNTLKDGWNWVSHNQKNDLPVTAFVGGVKRVVSHTAEATVDPVLGMVGNLETISAEQSVKVLSEGESQYNVSGAEYNPSANYINLSEGWNWVGYPLTQAMSPDEALKLNDMEEGDVLSGQDGFAEYTGGKWTGTLEMLEPGLGYMVKSVGNKRILYDNTVVSNVRAYVGHELSAKMPEAWTPNKYRYPNTMNIVAQLEQDGSTVTADKQYTVAAFAGKECRGVGKWVGDRIYLTAYGNTAEPLSFFALDNDSQTIIELSTEDGSQLPFKADVRGSYSWPFVLTTGNATSIAVTEEGLDLEPAEVFNLSGMKIQRPTRGINILRFSDGRTRKVLVK